MASAESYSEYVKLHENTSETDVKAVSNISPLRQLDAFNPTICVICLERTLDEASAIPCRHDQFHFSCLGTWLQQSRACPLCKGEVKGIAYHEVGSSQKVYYLAEIAPPPPQSNPTLRRGRSRRDHQRRSSFADGRVNRVLDTTLAFRKCVYDQQMYSSYIGSNRFSKYRNVTSESFHTDSTLIPKAKVWIRRELAVFDFLQPTSPAFGRLDRRATNAEYLLEYIVAILKSIDIRGSAGQATELLKEFLGAENARLFLHELENWLRSPFQDLKSWDRFVQYTAR